jgi:adenylate cyclase
VNGERVTERPLRPGDEITLGSTRMVFEAEDVPEGARQSQVPTGSGTSRVTIAPNMVESHIRTKLAPLLNQTFLPAQLVPDADALRADYEKLRVSYEVIRSIGVELDVDKLLAKILECAFQLLPADRGVVLLYDYGTSGNSPLELVPRCVRTKKASAAGEDVVLSTTIINEVVRDKAAVLSSDASVDSRFQGAHSVIMQGIRSSMAVPLLHSGELFGIMVLDSQIATNAFTEKDLQLFQNVANQAAIAIQNSLYATKLEQAAITRGRIQKLLSPAIADQVLDGGIEINKGGELRDTTILFTDIRGFTAMSESRAAQNIVHMLNEYFELMVEIIFKYEGTLDKFVGDEIMALFGSPVAHGDDAYRAVKTALEMLTVLEEFNRQRVHEGQEALKIGIGINTGEVVAGYLGSSRALEYTVIGDPVNTGSRLCSVAKAGEIIISEHTYARVKEHFEVIELPPTNVKGKAQALKIYNVIRERAGSFSSDLTRPV